MSVQLVTYSGKDSSFSMNTVLTGPIVATGVSGQGIANLSVEMTVDQSSIQVGMDGAVVPSVIPGDQGIIEIQTWQTASLHQEFLNAYNALKAARDAGDVSNWYSSTIFIQNIVTGSQHNATGVAFLKVPQKVYSEQAQRVSWRFLCCNVSNQ